MRIDLPDTNTSEVAGRLVTLRRTGQLGGSSRVLTLLAATRPGNEEQTVAEAQAAAREHPCRVIVVVEGDPDSPTRLDGEIHAGPDAGASEVVVLSGSGDLAWANESLVSALLLPDDPVVTWWQSGVPTGPSRTPLGRMSQVRITDSQASRHPMRALRRLADTWAPGDTDLAWTRLTLWRSLIAGLLDQFGHQDITGARVRAGASTPTLALMAAWLHLGLDVPVEQEVAEGDGRLLGVVLTGPEGDIALERPEGDMAQLSVPGRQPQFVALPRRTTAECLAEELRRLEPDEVFGDVLRHASEQGLLQDG